MSRQSDQDYLFELARIGRQQTDWRYWKKMAEDYSIALRHIQVQSQDPTSRERAAQALDRKYP